MLLARTRTLQRLFVPSVKPRRYVSTSQSTIHSQWSARSKGTLVRIGVVTGILGGTTVLYAKRPIHADTEEEARDLSSAVMRKTSLSDLVRSYFVYTACSFPTLVDWSPAMISACFSVPILKDVTEAVLRRTFFSQFVGGDTAEDVVPLLAELRGQNKGALFAYSVEVDEKEAAGKAKHGSMVSNSNDSMAPYKRNVEEMIHSIDVAANFEDRLASESGSNMGRKTWVAVKLTALLPDSNSLIKLSSLLLRNRALNKQIAFPGCPSPSDLSVLYKNSPSEAHFSAKDIEELKRLHDNLVRICTRAKERGVRIIVDAEHSWYQPAIDAYTLSLMRTFNKLPPATKKQGSRFGFSSSGTDVHPAEVQPLVYATFQAYLRRAYPYLLQSLADAQAGNYALGVKLVRGAYHSQEIATHRLKQSGEKSICISPDPEPPVHLSKDQTDFCYNECVRLLISRVRDDVNASQLSNSPPTLGLLFGSHNGDSCNLVLGELVRNGLAGVQDDIVHVPDAVAERVTIAQLYGMRDSLTNSLVEKTRCNVPIVMKYVPYGGLAEVMPYLSRRAIENKTVLGGSDGASAERKQAWLEIKKRVFG